MERAPGLCAPRLPNTRPSRLCGPSASLRPRSFAQLGVMSVAQLLGHRMGKSCFAAAGSRDIRLQRLCGGGGVSAGWGIQGDPET
ncbi:hypothetical protein NDU88_009388 [Pleurodeles waltl]|uniref:Uncharacterized protein n=1 Tax=Pleurodeles waltl TaxID=8319 RepID=A0AAV7RYW2_PLEWA|nr:hypothetical protein NDU88_009388 [Pleurodeles waltl]